MIHHFRDHSSGLVDSSKSTLSSNSSFSMSSTTFTFISSGENSIKTIFESAMEVKTGSHVKVAQPGQFNFPG